MVLRCIICGTVSGNRKKLTQLNHPNNKHLLPFITILEQFSKVNILARGDNVCFVEDSKGLSFCLQRLLKLQDLTQKLVGLVKSEVHNRDISILPDFHSVPYTPSPLHLLEQNQSEPVRPKNFLQEDTEFKKGYDYSSKTWFPPNFPSAIESNTSSNSTKIETVESEESKFTNESTNDGIAETDYHFVHFEVKQEMEEDVVHFNQDLLECKIEIKEEQNEIYGENSSNNLQEQTCLNFKSEIKDEMEISEDVVVERPVTASRKEGVSNAYLKRKNKFKCKKCEKSFADNAHVEEHNRRMHSNGDFFCSKCNVVFEDKCSFQKHSKSCLYMCCYPPCLKSFTRKNRFESHCRWHIMKETGTRTTCRTGKRAKCTCPDLAARVACSQARGLLPPVLPSPKNQLEVPSLKKKVELELSDPQIDVMKELGLM